MLTRVLLALVTIAALAWVPPALAQQGARASDPVEKLMDDFVHYVRIDKPDLAADVGKLILAKGLTEREFAAMIEDGNMYSDFQDALGKALRYPEVEPIVAEMDRLYREGKRSEARDPREISKNIALLEGNLRARRMGRQRLFAASEYAMVQLLEAYLDRNDNVLRTEVESVMIDMGPGAVTPLCTALPQLQPADQESVVKVLGIIGYRTALPYIAELRDSTNVGAVRVACDRAVERITDEGQVTASPATLYRDLAEGYFDERSELTIFPAEQSQLLWSFDPALGLLFTPIATPVYHEAMTMRLTEHAMRLDPTGTADALSLWTAANLRREIETPEAYDNPAYPADRRGAEYYAVYFGPETCQAVLARALEDDNTQLARRAIGALAKTAGGPALWVGDDRKPAPLLSALQYPDRRVQYDAALVLGAAQPHYDFPGSERVVPTLASAVRDAAQRYAVMITPDRDSYNELRGLVSGLGYNPLAFSATLADAIQAMADIPGVDLLIIDEPTPDTAANVLTDARNVPKLAVSPTLLLASAEGAIDLTNRYRNDRLVTVRRRAIPTDMMQNGVNELVERGAGGPITPDEARDYTARALTVLRDLAMAENTVLDAGDAVAPLISSLADADPQTQLLIAEVLARIEQPRAQVAVMDTALSADGDQQARLLDAVASSARRFGNMLEPRQVNELMEITRFADAREATSAAALMGSLNLPNRELVPFVLDEESEQVGLR